MQLLINPTLSEHARPQAPILTPPAVSADCPLGIGSPYASRFIHLRVSGCRRSAANHQRNRMLQ